ncbi:hypothetical protein DPSP01_004473 [Paraphaeosphaeria sporulosa]
MKKCRLVALNAMIATKCAAPYPTKKENHGKGHWGIAEPEKPFGSLPRAVANREVRKNSWGSEIGKAKKSNQAVSRHAKLITAIPTTTPAYTPHTHRSPSAKRT